MARRGRRGVSLIETVVALALLGLIGGALAILIAQITATSNSANFKNQATTYAEEAVEQVRDFRNANGWASLTSTINSSCGGVFQDGTLTSCSSTSPSCSVSPLLSGDQIGNTSFCRYVQLTQPNSPDQVIVGSVVKWLEKGVVKTVEVDTYLYYR